LLIGVGSKIKNPIKKKVFCLVKESWNEKPSDFMEGIDNIKEHIPEKKLREEIGYTKI